mgnify:CR=1 FL=1
MKKNVPLGFVCLFLIGWTAVLSQLYEHGKGSKALIYAKIHPETIAFLDSLSNRLDLFIRYDPGIRPDDWKDRRNYGEDPETGLGKVEDEFFVVYFKKDEGERRKAEKVLEWANECIPALAGLLGKYPYPKDVNGRKVPIYLADHKDRYADLAEILLGEPYNRIHQTVGVYFSCYSRMGNLTIGILLSPEIWRNDTYAREVLRHEMNHYGYFTLIEYDKAIRPYMWVYEGLAEYFSQSRILQLTTDQIRQCSEYTLSATFPDYNSNYWGGESVYCFMEDRYGKELVKAFIQQTYSNTVGQASVFAFGKELKQLEDEWKQWLQH